MPLVIIVVAWLTRRIHSKFNKLADDPGIPGQVMGKGVK